MILTRLRSGTDSTADSRKVTLVLSGSFSSESTRESRRRELIIVVHEEALIGSPPGVIEF